MLYLTYIIDILFLVGLPIAVGIFLVRKFYLEGRWWWIGAVTYVISQVLFQPFQNYLINPFLNKLNYSGTLPSLEVLILGGLLLGLIGSLCEELLRFAMFRWWANDARSFMSSLLLGIGHGGAGSIILGFLVLYNFLNMAVFRNKDLTAYVSADQVNTLQTQINAFWSAPWYFVLRESIGQLFMLIIQVSLSLLVLQTFIRRQWFWMIFAIGFHTLVEAARVIVSNLSNENMVNAIIGIFAVISIAIIIIFQRAKISDKVVGNVGDKP
jgi:uncharacterized membrane protein YhfC